MNIIVYKCFFLCGQNQVGQTLYLFTYGSLSSNKYLLQIPLLLITTSTLSNASIAIKKTMVFTAI